MTVIATPSNCRLKICLYNQIPPPENSQECMGCEGNYSGLVYRGWKWLKATAPAWTALREAEAREREKAGKEAHAQTN